MRKLGLIAGGGELPFVLARRCQVAGRPLFVARLRGFADPGLEQFPGAEIGMAELGRMFAELKRAGVEAVCFAGNVKRPDFSALKPDLRGLKSLPGAIAAARQGDDALLRFLLREFEREGFHVEGAHEVDASLTLPLGPLGRHDYGPAHAADLAQAIAAARAIGRLDIGQGVVVVDGVVLAVEAQEGTDAMLRRCADLPSELRGTQAAPRGVLVKWPKPIQERRMDMPTLGVTTIELAAAAGLAGIVGEAESMLVMDREALIAAADRLGLFVCGAAAEPES
ncbi:MAG: UDP-2,3-diacylglucosamine diphosphatase [Caulobacteraceae bacterium]